MTTPVNVAVKRETTLQARWAPASAHHHDILYLSWVDPRGTVRVARTDDLRSFDEVFNFGRRSRMATALAADESGLVLGLVPSASREVHLIRSRDGMEWGRPIRTGIRWRGAPRIAVHQQRIWLVGLGSRRRGYEVSSSTDGVEWQLEYRVKTRRAVPPMLVELDGTMHVIWVGERGELLISPMGSGERAPATELHEGTPSPPSVLVNAGTVYLAWSDSDTDEIHVLARTRLGWRERTVLHDRTEGPPSLVALDDGVGVAWVRADGAHHIHVQAAADAAIIEESHVFSGDVQGHPTALSSDHQTPYPYLGIVVLPSDWSLPQGATAAGLTSALDTTLDDVRGYWKEASFGAVDITHDVHPSVVTLPSPMATYYVKSRPKLIEGFGASYPITFTGSMTLELAAAGNFALTITFPNASLDLGDVITEIDNAIAAASYTGPADSKPRATRSEIDQLRIRTTGRVDPGDPLDVTGGTALVLLGLDPAHRTVYEGSVAQTNHLNLMLRDALKAVAQTKPDPAAFLSTYYGCAISIASNLGWWGLRANASMGPDDVAVLPGENDFKIAHYFVTSMTHDETHGHEVGHNLNLPDQYEEGNRFVGTELGGWDGMDGNSFSHPAAWAKAYRSAVNNPGSRWLDGSHVATVDSTTQSVEVLLAPLESEFPTTNPFAVSHPGVPLRQAVKVEIASGSAYYVENRQRGAYDDPDFGRVQYSQSLPGDGIIITDAVDDLASLSIGRANVVLVHPIGFDVGNVPHTAIDQIMAAATVAAKQAIIDAYVPAEIPQSTANRVATATTRAEIVEILRLFRDGQVRAFYPVDTLGEDVLVHQFPNGDGEIRVKVLEVIGTSAPYVYLVRVSWGRQGSWFDLEVRKWQGPPPYESEDIWIDSEENGWDTYEHSDPVANPGVAGNPVLNGDRPWVGHNNLVKARVWNRGDIAQNNVRVDFREVVPPGQSAGYIFDTDYVDIPAGGSAIAAGTWRPHRVPASEHGCVSAQVEYRPWDVSANVIGEMNSNNNTAQENIDDFYLSSASPYSAIELPFQFTSPLPEPSEMKLRAHGLEPGWAMRVEPFRFHLQPDESMQGMLILEAADTVPLKDREEHRRAPTVSLEALVRIGCTWEPIGGFSMVAHTVRKSELEVGVDPAGGGAHVTIRARDTIGPIQRAPVAIGLVLDGERSLSVTRVETDIQGRAYEFVPIDWAEYGPGARLTFDVRLSPTGQSGPAATTVPIPHP